MRISLIIFSILSALLLVGCKTEQVDSRGYMRAVNTDRYIETQGKDTGKKRVDNSPVDFRHEKVEAEKGYEGKLKKYSVVAATVTREEQLLQLKNAFAGENEPIVIAKSKKGLYYFIVGSYEDEDRVMDKREMVKRRYKDPYTIAQMKDKYGIILSDIWVLIRTY